MQINSFFMCFWVPFTTIIFITNKNHLILSQSTIVILILFLNWLKKCNNTRRNLNCCKVSFLSAKNKIRLIIHGYRKINFIWRIGFKLVWMLWTTSLQSFDKCKVKTWKDLNSTYQLIEVKETKYQI